MDVRVSGLDHITLDAIGAWAVVMRRQHADTALPDCPKITDRPRAEFLRDRLADVEAAVDGSSRIRALCALAAAAGMWMEYIDAAEAKPVERVHRPAPKLTRAGQRTPSDPGIDYSGDER